MENNEELLTGMVVVTLIIVLLFALCYYFIVFAPQETEFNNLKQEKINHVNSLLNQDENHNKEAIISEIERCNSLEDLNNLDVDLMIYPILKNSLMEQLNQYQDKYHRVELVTENSTDIMKIKDARNYIDSQEALSLSNIQIKPVDSIIIPLNINRKQAASGLITEGDVIDIYKTNSDNREVMVEDTNQSDFVSYNYSTSKIVGGSQVISILRSKDSGSISQNIVLTESPKNRNFTQESNLDIQQIISSKAAGTYDSNQYNITTDDYGDCLANYERISHIGELDVEYILLVEVPRNRAEDLINNMDNIILTIPTYDAPSWVEL
jgi:hypothetical protein